MAVSDQLHPVFGHVRTGKRTASGSQASTRPRRHHRWRWLVGTLAGLIVLLVAARLAAPAIIRHELNKMLTSTPGYTGHVDRVRLHLYRGAYAIEGLTIRRTDADGLPPLLTTPRIDLSVGWWQLVHGAVVGRILIESPSLFYAVTATARQVPTAQSPLGAPASTQASLGAKLQHSFPFAIDEVRIRNGTIRYLDTTKHIDMSLGKVQAVVTNLTNRAKLSHQHNRIAALDASGDAIGNGALSLRGDIDPYATAPTFSIRFRLLHLDLTALNPVLDAYEHFNIRHGRLDLLIDANAKNGHLSGYAKPLLLDLSVYSPQDLTKKGGLKEAVVGAIDKIFKNHPKDQFATVVPLDGTIGAPGTSVLSSIIGVLRNGFIRALTPQFEHGAAAKAQGLPQASPQAQQHAAKALAQTQQEATHHHGG